MKQEALAIRQGSGPGYTSFKSAAGSWRAV
jgi:hypothetical protein